MSNLLVKAHPDWAERGMLWLAQVAGDQDLGDFALRVAVVIAWGRSRDGGDLAQASYRALQTLCRAGRTAVIDACKALVERGHLTVTKVGRSARSATVYRPEVRPQPIKSRGGRRPAYVDVVTVYGRLTVASRPAPSRAAAAAQSPSHHAARAARSESAAAGADEHYHQLALADGRGRRAQRREQEEQRAQIADAIQERTRTGVRHVTPAMRAAAQEAELRERKERERRGGGEA